MFSSLSVHECLCVKKVDGGFFRNKKKGISVFDGFIDIGFFAPALLLLTRLTPKVSPRSYQQILSVPALSLSLFVALL